MKKLTLLLLLLVATSHLCAQSGTVEGILTDATTQDPIDFASVGLVDPDTQKAVEVVFSDVDGHFTLHAKYGTYTLTATLLGYQTIERTVTISDEKPSVKLGKVNFEPLTQQIEEVQVVGQRSAMRLEIDKKVFNVEQSLLSEGANATEILQNIPTVDVDTEGNVSLRNSSNVEIWINGRPSGLSGSDKADILDMLPAESVKSVELITNPSSKHNPEGSAGIINIVLKNDHKAGYMASVNAGLQYQEGARYPGGNLGFNYNYSSKKWDVNLSANARSNRRENGAFTHRTTFADGDTTLFDKDNLSANDRANGFLRTGFTYYIDHDNEFGMTAFGMYGKNWNRKEMQYTTLGTDSSLINSNNRHTNGTGQMGFYNVSADYKHCFVKDVHELSANVNFRHHINHSGSLYTNTDFDGNTLSRTYQNQTMHGNNKSVSVQIDYLNKFSKNSKFEAGAKVDLAFNNTLDQTFDSAGFVGHAFEFDENILPLISLDDTISTTSGWTENIAKKNPFDYREQIYALYASYGNRIDWFSFQVGLRGEYTRTQANEISREYFEVFPSAYMSFTLPKENELQLNYTRRINRPRGRRINSFIDRSDQTNITFGNPLLMPEFANNVELNYLKNWEQHTLTVGLFYRYTENVIETVRTVYLDTMMTTYENITFSQNAGAEIIAKDKLFHNYLDLTTSVSAYYYQLGGNEAYNIAKTENFSWRAKINANIRILDNLSAQVSGNYNSPRLIAQGRTSHTYSMDVGLKATFLNKSLSLTASVRDVLNSRSRMTDTTYSDNFYQEAGRTTNGRTYRIALSYKFGNLNGKQKKNKNKNRNESEELGEDSDFDF
ncbi:MAG: TonB-dependent receptor [Paludibacteraceae bacterium]|nr:TonB-dependent receptor [Paludibacteraceae bacterium]